MRNLHYYSLIVAFTVGCFTSWSQTYVDITATGSNDGSSWSNAYTDLSQAIYNATSGDEIWVSQGTYIPTINETGVLPTSLRLRHFWLKDGVKVYGGFNGTEADLNARNLATQRAVLDGQVDASNKAYHVISTDAASSALLDGFIVRNGDSGTGSTEGVSNSGGGLYLTGDAQFFNIDFENNIAYHHGGGVYAYTSNSIFVACRFDGNTTTLYDGAAIYAHASTMTFYNCILYNNVSARFGGALTANASTVNFQNSSIVSCTGLNMYQVSAVSTVNTNQSLLWGNTGAIGLGSGGGNVANFNECVYQFAASGSNISGDPQFTNYLAGDLTLQPTSPAIDGVATTPYNPYRDIIGNLRIIGTALDMGAYEYGSHQGLIKYVDKDATGANNGSSWANAFTTIEASLVNATFSQGEEIWIADGTYTPHASDRSATWLLPNGMKLYGGFNGTETARSQRNPATNIAVLSGDLSGNDNANMDFTEATRQDNSYRLFQISGPKIDIIVDGLTLSDANANGTGNQITGGVLSVFHSGVDHTIEISFNNVIVEDNTSTQAAIYQNYHYFSSGGTTIVNFSHSVIRNNIGSSIHGNIQYRGHRTNNQKNYGTIDNCLFYENGNNSTSGAATLINSVASGFGVVSPMVVTNNTFTKNTVGNGYVMVIDGSSDSRYRNNIFYGNGTNSPILWINSGVTSTVFQNCISEDPLFGLNQDPLFRDAANNDFRVDCSGLSPTIDGGTSTNVVIADLDFAGLPRTAGTVDIGAHEFQSGIEIDASVTSVCPGDPVTLTASNATGITWDMGVVNGSPFTPSVTATYTASGTTANNCAESSSVIIEATDLADYTVTATPTSLCSSGSVTVDLSGSSITDAYILKDNTTNAILDGPVYGTGAAMSFNSGVLSNTTTLNVTAGKLLSTNRAFDLDGSGDYLFLGSSNRSVGATMTISTRVKANPSSNIQWLAVKFSSPNGYYLYINAAGKANIEGRDGDGTYKVSGPSTTTVTDGEWHEITGVVSSTGWSIYVDGVLESTGAYSPGPTGLASGANSTVGAYNSGFGTMDYDQLTIWNTALDATGVQAIMTTCFTGTEPNVVGHFDFEETSGTTLIDHSPTAINGVIYGLNPATQSIDGPLNACSEFCEEVMDQPIVITIEDNQAPVADVATLSDVSAQCSVTSLTPPTATDNCVGALSGSHNGTLPISSSTSLTWTYDDGNGNTSTQAQNIVINDMTAPIPDVATLSDLTAQCAITSLASPTSTDNCVGSISGSHNATLPISSSTNITWTYDDGNGNTSTQVQNVVINDNIAPVANVASLSNLTAQCEITSLTAPTATDNCVGGITGTHTANLPISASTSITWTYDDGNGNTSTQMQNVVINDNTAPVANAGSLADVTAQCSVTSLPAPTANDNCVGSITGTQSTSFPITASTTIMWTYDDGNGNTSTQNQNVVINDNTSPIADAGSLTDLSAQCEITALTSPTATDNCVGSITGAHNATLPISTSSTITWTYDDGNGNTSTQTQNVVINDNTAPTADVANLSDLTAQCSISSLTAPNATDNCLGSITGTHNTSLPIMTSSAVIWTYDDGNGNISTQTQNVVINDNTAPVPDLATLADVTSECEVTSLSNPSATDNCSAVLVSSNASLPISASTTIMWTYMDNDGNSSTQNQNIVINDVTAPIADVATLSDLTAQCEITTLTAPTATDNCVGSIMGTHTALLPLTSSTIITWTFDDGEGNTSTQTQNVVINDNTLPIADATSLSDLTAACEITTLTSPTATDNCVGAITGSTTTPLPISASTLITWNYDDGNGNIATQTQNVIINDNLAPVADVAVLSDVNETCEVTALIPPTATDNCLGVITGTHSATLPISINTLVTWTYDDGNGNITTQDQQVNITDALAPVADVAALVDITEVCEVTTLTVPTATDNCSGQVSGTHNATLPITVNTVVTWTYVDGNGNMSTQDQQVNIDAVDANVTLLGTTITADNAAADSYQWVDCNNGNAPIAGETNQSFTATSNGSYAVEVTTGSCTETSGCETISTIGLDENTQITVSVYPNPAMDVLNISTESSVEEVLIYDIAGSLVQAETTTSFSVADLATGTYTLRIKTDLGLVRKRFVKE